MRTWHYFLTAAIFTLSLVLFVVRFLTSAPTVPPYVQFQADFSKEQMALFYAKADRELLGNYWGGPYRDVKALQPKPTWHELWNGKGSIQGILTDLNSNVVAYVRFRDGNSYWLTVQSASDPGFAKLEVSPVGGRH